MSDQKLPLCPQKGSYEVHVKKGQLIAWCTCGMSQKQPLCDAAHRGTDYKSLKIVAEKDETLYLCGCKQTKNPPFCDGSHREL